MLHRHLTAAFRALDSKWGDPVDLDTPQEPMKPCQPAVIEKPSTTFSSEEYLKTIRRRPKPYSRKEGTVCRRNRTRDSFSNISVALCDSSSDLGSVSSVQSKAPESSVLEELKSLIEDLRRPLEDPTNGTAINEASNSDGVVEKKKNELETIFEQLKQKAFSYVEEKYKTV